MTRQIFISYRREDSLGSTGRLYDRLRAHFKDYGIFIDVDTISPGEDFVEAVKKAVDGCDVLIAVIGNKWLKITDKNDKRVLDDEVDFVRTEIRAALQRKVKVIPVLIENALMPDSGDLPDDLKGLAHINAIEISHTRFNDDVDRLIKVLEKYFQQIESSDVKNETPKPKHDEPADTGSHVKPLPLVETAIVGQQEKAGNDISQLPPETSERMEESPNNDDDYIVKAAKGKKIKKYVFIAAGTLILIFAIWKFMTPSPGGNDTEKESTAVDQSTLITDTSQMPAQQNIQLDTTTILPGKETVKFTPPKVVKDEETIDENKKAGKSTATGVVKGERTAEEAKKAGFTSPGSVKDVTTTEETKNNNDEKILRKVEVEAQFPGGPSAWAKYIQQAIQANQDAFTEKDYGTCIVKFIVDNTGGVSNVEATTMINTKLAEVATNAIRKGPKWSPAQQNGRYVKAYRLQPVTLKPD